MQIRKSIQQSLEKDEIFLESLPSTSTATEGMCFYSFDFECDYSINKNTHVHKKRSGNLDWLLVNLKP